MDLHQIIRPGPLHDWLELPEPIFESIIQYLYDSTSNRQDVLHALLVCKRWAAAAGTLSYTLDLTYSGGTSLAYDLPGVAWLLRRSMQVVKLTLKGDSGAACGTLQALQWDSLCELWLEGPEDSFGQDALGEGPKLGEVLEHQRRVHVIQTANDAFFLVATHPWDALPAAERLPCLERLVVKNYALLNWRFAANLRMLELVMPSSGSDWEDSDGIMWQGKLQALQPLPALEILRLELPLYDCSALASCFGGESANQPGHKKVWPSLQHLDITMLHMDSESEGPVFSVASLPRLQSLHFMSVIEQEHEWDLLFAKDEVWSHLKHMAVKSSVGLRLSAAMFPAARLSVAHVQLVPQEEEEDD